MSTNTLTLNLTAGNAQQISRLSRFLFVKSATAALDITLIESGSGTPNLLTSMSAGTKFKRLDGQPWRRTDIVSATNQTVTIVLSDDAEIDISSTVSVAGTVAVQDTPSSAIASPAAVSVAAATAQTIAANPARRRISICSPSSNNGSMFLQAVGAGAGLGIELQPGVTLELRTTAAIDVRNDSTGPQAFVYLEET